MGSVWRAHHLTLNAPVAIKLIDPALASSPDAQARFIREAQAAAALRSPNVVQTLDFGVDDGIPYIVMELLIGENLADRLARVGRLTPAQTARVVVDVAKAIGKAHAAEIVHRDLKPDNVFLARDEDDEVVKVVDFGVAKATGMVGASTSRTRTGAILGTPYYMSGAGAGGQARRLANRPLGAGGHRVRVPGRAAAVRGGRARLPHHADLRGAHPRALGDRAGSAGV